MRTSQERWAKVCQRNANKKKGGVAVLMSDRLGSVKKVLDKKKKSTGSKELVTLKVKAYICIYTKKNTTVMHKTKT